MKAVSFGPATDKAHAHIEPVRWCRATHPKLDKSCGRAEHDDTEPHRLVRMRNYLRPGQTYRVITWTGTGDNAADLSTELVTAT